MSKYKIVDALKLDSDLARLAEAIRKKGGTSAPLEFPEGMIEATENIPEGMGQIEIEVDELPVKNIKENAIYRLRGTFCDVALALPYLGVVLSLNETIELLQNSIEEDKRIYFTYHTINELPDVIDENYKIDVTGENIPNNIHLFYLEKIFEDNPPDIYFYIIAEDYQGWMSLTKGLEFEESFFRGSIAQTDEASLFGYYAIVTDQNSCWKYEQKKWKKVNTIYYVQKVPPIEENTKNVIYCEENKNAVDILMYIDDVVVPIPLVGLINLLISAAGNIGYQFKIYNIDSEEELPTTPSLLPLMLYYVRSTETIYLGIWEDDISGWDWVEWKPGGDSLEGVTGQILFENQRVYCEQKENAGFTDIVIVSEELVGKLSDLLPIVQHHVIPTRSNDVLMTNIEQAVVHIYYIEDENALGAFIYDSEKGAGFWEVMNTEEGEFRGKITGLHQVYEAGIYALFTDGNKRYDALQPKGWCTITENNTAVYVGDAALAYVSVPETETSNVNSIDGILQRCRAAKGSDIDTGDFVEFIENVQGGPISPYTNLLKAIAIDEERVLIVYSDNRQGTTEACVLSCSESGIVTDDSVIILSYPSTEIALSLIRDNTVLVSYCSPNYTSCGAMAKVLSITGTTIAQGNQKKFGTNTLHCLNMITLANNKALIAYRDGTRVATNILTVNNATITVGTQFLLGETTTVGPKIALTKLTETSAFVIYFDSSTDYLVKGMVLNIEDSTIVAGDIITLDETWQANEIALIYLDENKFFAFGSLYWTNEDGSVEYVTFAQVVRNENGQLVKGEPRYIVEQAGNLSIQKTGEQIWASYTLNEQTDIAIFSLENLSISTVVSSVFTDYKLTTPISIVPIQANTGTLIFYTNYFGYCKTAQTEVNAIVILEPPMQEPLVFPTNSREKNVGISDDFAHEGEILYVYRTRERYNIEYQLTNFIENSVDSIEQGLTKTVQISPVEGYAYPDSIEVIGANHTWDRENGNIELSQPTENIQIIANAIKAYGIVFNNTGISSISQTYPYDNKIRVNDSTTFTLSAKFGYMLPDTIIVEGVTNYTWDKTTGKLTLAEPISDVNITVSAIEEPKFKIVTNLTNCSISLPNNGYIYENTTENLTISASSGYTYPSTISVEGATSTYSGSSSQLKISNPTAQVVITADAVRRYKITATSTNVSYVNNPSFIDENTSATLTYHPVLGFRLPDTVTVEGVTSYVWNKETGKLVITKPTDDVNIVIEAIETQEYDIVTELINCTVSGDTSIHEDWTATLTVTADSLYTRPESIEVENADFTYDIETGVIRLSNPTGTVKVIIIAPRAYSITLNRTNIYTNSANPTNIVIHKTATLTFEAAEGYKLPKTVEVEGATAVWENEILTLSEPTADVVVTIEGEAIHQYTINILANNTTLTGIMTFRLIAEEGKNISTSNITVSGANTWSYTPSTSNVGNLSLSEITDDVQITISPDTAETTT